MSATGALSADDLGLRDPEGRSVSAEELVTLAESERRHIARVLAHTEGRIYGERGAAKILGVPPSTLQSRMKKLGF